MTHNPILADGMWPGYPIWPCRTHSELLVDLVHTIHPFFSTVVPTSSAVSVILKVDKDDAGAILLSVSVLGPLLAVVSIVPNHSFRKNNGIIFWLGWIGKTLK
jgi:hypothetical protein